MFIVGLGLAGVLAAIFREFESHPVYGKWIRWFCYTNFAIAGVAGVIFIVVVNQGP